MSLQMIPVQSRMFSSLGFNPDTSEIFAQYITGTLGAYHKCTREEFEAVLNDKESVGSAFNRLIKPTKKYRKVENGLDDGPANSIIDHDLLYVKAAPVSLPPVTVEPYVYPPAPGEADTVVLQAETVAKRANSLEILDEPTHVAAQEVMVAIAETKAAVTTFFKPMKKAADEAHAAICAREKSGLIPLENAQKHLSAAIITYRQAQERARIEQQERLRAEQQAKADADAKAESERLAIEDALKLEAAGDVTGAMAVLNNPVPVAPAYVPPAIVATTTTRVTGAVAKKVWKARIVNPALIPRDYLKVDEAAIQAYAGRAGELAKMPGVEFYPDESVHGRRSQRS